MTFSLLPKDNPDHPDITLLEFSSNPLPPCPSSPNCERRSYRISRHPETIFPMVLISLKQMHAQISRTSEKKLETDAVFSIFLFNDDVSIVLKPRSSETILHIRSASRKGRYDFGVNRRRINRFIKLLGRRL